MTAAISRPSAAGSAWAFPTPSNATQATAHHLMTQPMERIEADTVPATAGMKGR